MTTSLIGSIGRWHGGHTPARHIKNEIARHEAMITEWLEKRHEATLAIRHHRAALKQLRAAQDGVAP